MKKVLVSLPDGIVSLLDKELKGKLGEGHSDTLRAIIMNWLGEKGYLTKKGEKCEQE
jgi:metal-responsive CopG/Arc/MetJ family transcriptional regulator